MKIFRDGISESDGTNHALSTQWKFYWERLEKNRKAYEKRGKDVYFQVQ